MNVILHLTENSPEPLRSQVARQIRSKVIAGALPGGSMLPEAGRFARRHHLAPACVREALETLVAEGVLEPADGERFRVASVSPEARRILAQRRALDDRPQLTERQLELAGEVQRRLLPPTRVDGVGYTVVSRSIAAGFVAGDFFDVICHADGTVGVIVADVAGKGLAAGMVMAAVKAMTPFLAEGRGVAETLSELNGRLCAELGPRQFVALAYARLSPASGAVELANAAMPDPFVVSPGRVPVPVEVSGPRLPLGARAGVRYQAVTFTLEEGARLLLFSDGLPEAPLPSGEPLGYERLAAIVPAVGKDRRCLPPVEAWLDLILAGVARLTTPALEDDWTAAVIERSGTA